MCLPTQFHLDEKSAIHTCSPFVYERHDTSLGDWFGPSTIRPSSDRPIASRLWGPTPSLEGFRPQGQDRPRAALTTKRLKSGLITRFWTQALASQFGAGLCRDRGVRFHI